MTLVLTNYNGIMIFGNSLIKFLAVIQAKHLTETHCTHSIYGLPLQKFLPMITDSVYNALTAGVKLD